MGMNQGYSLSIDQSDQISFEWTFLANSKIEMPNSYVGDDLDPKFIPTMIEWGWIGDKPYLQA